jgi:hypothetical protein
MTRGQRNALWAFMDEWTEFKIGTQCSGTDGPVFATDQFIDGVCDRLQSEFGRTAFGLRHSYSCEINASKRAFIRSVASPEYLFGDCASLVRDSAPDYMRDKFGKTLVTRSGCPLVRCFTAIGYQTSDPFA